MAQNTFKIIATKIQMIQQRQHATLKRLKDVVMNICMFFREVTRKMGKQST